jgi:hypothetical protein
LVQTPHFTFQIYNPFKKHVSLCDQPLIFHK